MMHVFLRSRLIVAILMTIILICFAVFKNAYCYAEIWIKATYFKNELFVKNLRLLGLCPWLPN